MQRKRRYVYRNFVTVLSKFDIFLIGLRDYGAYFFVYRKCDFNVVKLWKIGKQANVSAVYGRSVKQMESEEAAIFVPP